MIDRRAHTGHLTLPRTSAALAITAAAVVTIGLVNTDSLVERGFASALSGPASGQVTRSAQSGVSGSEDFWLRGTRVPGTAPVSWSKPVDAEHRYATTAVEGERISITAQGREVVLEVVDVRPLPGAGASEPTATRIDTGEQPASLIVVTCREVGATADTRPIRFVVEQNAALPWRAIAAPAHTL